MPYPSICVPDQQDAALQNPNYSRLLGLCWCMCRRYRRKDHSRRTVGCCHPKHTVETTPQQYSWHQERGAKGECPAWSPAGQTNVLSSWMGCMCVGRVLSNRRTMLFKRSVAFLTTPNTKNERSAFLLDKCCDAGLHCCQGK